MYKATPATFAPMTATAVWLAALAIPSAGFAGSVCPAKADAERDHGSQRTDNSDPPVDGSYESTPDEDFDDELGPGVHIRGVNLVDPHQERRLTGELEGQLDAQSATLKRCLSADTDEVTVDWTITTDGQPVDVTVFSEHDAVTSCITDTLSALTYPHLETRQPRARVVVRR